MEKLCLFLIALATALLPATARADGFGLVGAAPSLDAPPYRYVALSPQTRHPLTVVEKIDMRDGTVDRWWRLPGAHYVPAVAYDRSPGGLSADGRTLVLTKFTPEYPPRRSRFAILRTDLHLRHPVRAGHPRPRHAVTHLTLPGSFSFDAISPDGSTIYLIHNFLHRGRPIGYEVRALETAGGRLLPEPIVDPEEPDEQMQGLPITRATSDDGRWAYTLYDGNGGEPFVHALDTVRGRAVCVDLPQLEERRNLFMLRLRLAHGGRELMVFDPSSSQDASRSPLLVVDTETFAVERPRPSAPTPGDGGTPWLPIGLGAALLAASLVWLRAKGQRAPKTPPLREG